MGSHPIGSIRLALPLWILAILAAGQLLFSESIAIGQDVWEYSPYKTNVWISTSPNIGLDASSEAELHRIIREKCENDFGGTIDIRVQDTPDALYGSVLYRIEELAVPQLLAREMTLVVGKSDAAKAKFMETAPPPPKVTRTPDEEAKLKKLSKEQLQEIQDAEARAASLNSVRTLESAIERIDAFHVLPLPFAGLKREMEPFEGSEVWKQFADKVKMFPGNIDGLKSALDNGEIVAALVPKTELGLIKDVCRPIPARLPWQPEALLRDYDKIFLVSIDRIDGLFRVRVKELDSRVRRMGEVSTQTVLRPQDLANSVATLVRQSFTAMVRIEETDNNTATLRVRAGGLIARESHPAEIGLGDVVVPHIRRDDSNGNPTVLQQMPFTYIALTEKVDATSMYYGAIFTASRGALTAAKNRRTQRLGLKVSAKLPASNLRLTYRAVAGTNTGIPPGAANGAEIYRRTPGHDDLEMMGRTDWRGILKLSTLDKPVIRYDIPTSSRNPGISNARSIVSNPVPPPAYPEPPKPELESTDEANPAKPPRPPMGQIEIHVPLYLYYVKNGSTLLARLPVITGMVKTEEARLPDDRRRLETEAYLKGLQNEVLDLVVRRKIFESRIKSRIAADKKSEATEIMNQLKRMKDYERMSEQIEKIQRRALDNQRGRVGPILEKKINEMVSSTRQIMQQWLQDNMLRDLETKLSETK